MKELGGIGIELLADKKDVGIYPNGISFTYTESIHRVLPIIDITYNDTSGIIQELLGFCEGREFTLKIKDFRLDEDEPEKTLDFVTVKEDRVYDNALSTTTISTANKITGYHVFYNNDEIRSTGYDESTSELVERILDNYTYRFKKHNIDTTSDKKLYFCPLKNDIDFINDIILPNCYHVSDTPMFCFIDSNNEFNYVSYDTILKRKLLAELTDLPNDVKEFQRDLVSDYKIVELGSDKLKKLRNKRYTYFNNDGEISELVINITDFIPRTKNNVLPIIKHSDAITGTQYLGDTGYEDSEDNHIRGKAIYENMDLYFIQRIQATLPYNYKYTAGKRVKLALHITGADDIIESIYYSFDYIIENNSIVWDGNTKTMTSILTLSRCQFNVDDDATIKRKLYKQ